MRGICPSFREIMQGHMDAKFKNYVNKECKEKGWLVVGATRPTDAILAFDVFLNISINFPGSTSDHLAWEGSCFKRTIEKEGYLVDLLCLFGDNAYINSAYLATPFPNAKLDQDDYSFFHSQLRINIECGAFGMLVMRWSVLTCALSSHYGLNKTKELVRCLCCLHNFCIDENDNIRSIVALKINLN